MKIDFNETNDKTNEKTNTLRSIEKINSRVTRSEVFLSHEPFE